MIEQRYGANLAERSVGELLRRLGFRRISVRPRCTEQDGLSQEVHKNLPDLVAAAIPAHARDKPIELWWQDEARVGQQVTLTRIWAERGSQPGAPRDQRYDWACSEPPVPRAMPAPLSSYRSPTARQ